MSKKLCVILLRSKRDARITAATLAGLNVDVISSPVITHRPLPSAKTRLATAKPEEFDALFLTSPHALDGLRLAAGWMRLPVYCVGKATANAARRHGCTNLLVASGTVRSLVRLAMQQNVQRPLYLRGQQIRRALKQSFNKLEEIVTYDTVLAGTLTTEAIKALNNRSDIAVLFSSLRIAKHFVSLIKKHDLSHCVKNINSICISEEIAQELEGNNYKSCIVSSWSNVRTTVQKLAAPK